MNNGFLVAQSFPEITLLQETFLTADIAAGVSTLPVVSVEGFDDQHAILIGVPGSERAEIVTPSSIAIGSIGITVATERAHLKDEPVYLLMANQVRFYRADAVVDHTYITGDFTVLGLVEIIADELQVEYYDEPDGNDYVYGFTYVNTIPATEIESDLDLSSVNSSRITYVDVDEVREEAGLKYNRFITDEYIQSKIDYASNYVNNCLVRAGYTLPLTEQSDVLHEIVLLIAAGKVLMKDDRAENRELNREGLNKVELGEKKLEEICGGHGLVGADGVAVVKETKVFGYPDKTMDAEVGREPYFKSNMKW